MSTGTQPADRNERQPSLFDAVREAEIYVVAETFNTTSVNANAARIMDGLLDLLSKAESERDEARASYERLAGSEAARRA